MSSAFLSRGFRLRLHEDIQSDGQARKRMNGFAEYLSIFSCREASSVVQSQLAKHRKLEPRPRSVLYKAHVPQKIWVICQAAMDWRPFSVREPGPFQGIIANTVLCWDWTKPTIGTEIKLQIIKGPIPGEGTKIKEKSQNTVTDETA